jgi:glutaredoxin-related protein
MNVFLPYYDDVIITFQKEALNNLLNNHDTQLSFDDVKKTRFIKFIESLNDADVEKILIDDHKALQIIYSQYINTKDQDIELSAEEGQCYIGNDSDSSYNETLDNDENLDKKTN